MFLIHSTRKKISSEFLDLDIENPLRGGTLAKIESSLYSLFGEYSFNDEPFRPLA